MALYDAAKLRELAVVSTSTGLTVLHEMAELGDIIKFDDLVSSSGLNLLSVYNIAHHAALTDQTVFLFHLNTKYNYPLDQPNEEKSTPLHIACATSAYKSINYLAYHNIDVDSANDKGNAPLYYLVGGHKESATMKFKQMLHLLVQKGASVHRENNNGMSPLKLLAEQYKLTTNEVSEIVFPTGLKMNAILTFVLTFLSAIFVLYALRNGLFVNSKEFWFAFWLRGT